MNEIDNIRDFEQWLNLKASNEQVDPIVAQQLNLVGYNDRLVELKFNGCLFLGCKISKLIAGHIVETGGVVISDIGVNEFSCHKSALYKPEELFNSFVIENPLSYKKTSDWLIYDEYMKKGKAHKAPIDVALMRRLHDHSISDALMELIEGRKVVAIMGGHSMVRASEPYAKVARIARTLTKKGFLMVSGGGPGAMEATNLGAYFAAFEADDLSKAIDILKVRPDSVKDKNGDIKKELASKEYIDPDWLARAFKVLQKFPLVDKNEECNDHSELCNSSETCATSSISVESGCYSKGISVGIPTWFYGHEPPNPFATYIAKYFANSVREDGLLAIASHGVIFAPGSAGTTQEIFQDACQNHYGTFKYISPMILMGEKHWTEKIPVWPLLQQVSRNKKYGKLLVLTDDEDEIVENIVNYKSEEYRS